MAARTQDTTQQRSYRGPELRLAAAVSAHDDRTMESRITTLELGFRDMRVELTGVNAKLDVMDAKAEASREVMTAKFVSLETTVNARLDSMDSRLDGMDTRLESMNTKIDDFRTIVDTKLTSMNGRLDEFQQIITAKLDAMTEKLSRFPTKIQFFYFACTMLALLLAATWSFTAFLLRLSGHAVAADAINAIQGK